MVHTSLCCILTGEDLVLGAPKIPLLGNLENSYSAVPKELVGTAE